MLQLLVARVEVSRLRQAERRQDDLVRWIWADLVLEVEAAGRSDLVSVWKVSGYFLRV